MRGLLEASLLVASLGSCAAHAPVHTTPYRSLVLDAARWIRSSARQTESGTVWPVDPRDPATSDTSLYAGSSGVVLFLLALQRATGEPQALDEARSGADALVAALDSIEDPGLYTGLAGVGFALLETGKATGDAKYRAAAERCVRRLEERATPAGRGLEWNGTTDIIAGSAGIGLFLLRAARELGEAKALETAIRAGEHLLELGQPEAGGLAWAMDPEFPRRMPNFSHGTAGIAYFLARLYDETQRREFLDGALAGATYLQAIALADGDTCLIYHDEPDGKELYYLGWCHGPVGTARLFYELQRVTDDPVWLRWMERSARALLASGIPEQETPGFWHNDGPCCGLAGVAEFFLDLHRATGERSYLDFSRRVSAVLIQRATVDESGARWMQAEHRVRPDELAAQTGWMQGAAGIGAWLLRLDSFEHGREVRIAFPDSPF